ncbi:MAG: pilus assembly protein [Acidobacteria bacterium]|jgi:hypothetical protein|nr:pilus assembly protein [Acidobacteriota bacterium]
MSGWNQFAGRLRAQEGTEIAEAALVLPLVFTLLIGIFWFGRAYNIYATVTEAAREGARVAAASSCASCGNAAPAASDVSTRIGEVLQASKLDPAQINPPATPNPTLCAGITPVPACSSSGNVRVCQGVRLNSTSNPTPECGVMVSFRYPYQFYFPFTSLNLQLIQIPASAELRAEY